MRKQNDGTKLQDELEKALKHYTEHHPGYYHRFPDTKSARGNYLKSQPGDYVLIAPVGAILIECKSTVVSAPLLTLAYHGNVGKNQLGKHRLWHRAGQPSLYLYGDMRNSRIEWHMGINVVKKLCDPILSKDIGMLSQSIPEIIRFLSEEKEVKRAS